MAEEKKKEVIEEKEKPVVKKEVKKQPPVKKKEEPKKKPKVLKPYIHIDIFLQTAIPFYGLSSMQANGFKNRMNGKHYQRDEQVFVDELKKYLNIK